MSRKRPLEEGYSKDEEFWQKLDQHRRNLIFLSEISHINAGKSSQSNLEDENNDEIEHLEDSGTVKVPLISKEDLLNKIEKLLSESVKQASENKSFTISVPNRRVARNTTFDKNAGIKLISNCSTVDVGLAKNKRKFGLLLHVLSKIHKLLTSNTFCTKRELFYQDVKLYKNQTVLDSIIEDIACMLGVQRIRLHLFASSKGKITGDLFFKDGDGNFVDCSISVVNVPTDINAVTNIQSEARFVLIVEKDAIYQILVDFNFPAKFNCIMVTGKGFPDVNTRQMLHKLWVALKIPIFALVDADPYGIEILGVYTYGSMAMSFDVMNLAVPHIQWIGILPSDIEKLQLPQTAVQKLTENDYKRANSLLTRIYMQSREGWSQQVKKMLKMQVKAEIEGLSKIEQNFLVNVYLPNKIRFGGWI